MNRVVVRMLAHLVVAALVVAGLNAATAAPAGAAAAPVVVSLTFDDATTDQYAAKDILSAHGMHGVFFANSGRIGTPGYLTAAQLSALAADGNEIGGHTVSHADLPTLPVEEQQRQICNDRVALLNLGFAVSDFAYPYGDTSAATAQAVAACGYNSARDVGGIVSPGSCAGCGYVETVPPAAAYNIATPDSVKADTTLADLQGYVIEAQNRGGGWVPLVMHHVCDGCEALSVSATTLSTFLDWLAAQAGSGVTVATIHDVVGGTVQPGVTGPPPSPVGTTANKLANSSMEAPGNATTPACWQHGGYGANSFAWSLTSDAHAGTVAQKVDVTAFTDGDVRLISPWDLGTCAPSALPGHTYQATGWYKTSATVRMVAYYRTTAGGWVWFAQTAALPPSSTYRASTLTIGPLPAGATAVSVGYSVRSTGSLTADDFVLVDADQTPPAVAVTAPAPDMLVRGAVPLAATAADPSGIAKVELLVNGAVVATVTAAPYVAAWDSTMIADQVVSVSARAYDTAGNTTVAASQMETVANSVPLDTVAPTVAVTSPVAAATVSGVVPLTAAATDDDQVAYVSYRVDGVVVGSAVTAPWTFAWDSTTVADGPATVSAVAVDRSGNEGTSLDVAVTVANVAADTVAPVSVAACNGGACSTGWYATAISVSLSATDAGSGVSAVRYTTDGSTPTLTNGTTYAAPFTVPASATVLYRAYDKVGNAEAVNTVPLLVDSLAPTAVRITSPAAGAVLTGTKPIVSASADNVGVVRVKFYVDNVFIGSRVTLPMQWNWDTTTVTKGTHALMVAAFDAAGNYTKSSTVTITVQ